MSTEINEANETKQSKKGGKAVKIIAGVLLSGCLLASLGLNIYQATASKQSNQKESDFIDYILDRIAEEEKKENEYIEDGFKVGGEYEIRSTTHISDAYKSGDDSQLSKEDKETLKMASDILDEVLEDGMTDYQKEEAVYKWMVKNIGHGRGGVISRPGMTRSAFTPYAVLTSRSAVCVGYATTFRLFLNMMGIDCHIVHNEYHSWDLVKLENDWYHVDIYSDSHGVLYANFNMTDDVARNGHSWDESALPEAKSVKYSPAVQNAVEVDGLMGIPAAMRESLNGKSTTLYYKFKAPLSEEEMGTADFLVNILDMVLSGGMLEEEHYYFRAAWYPSEQEDNYILGLLLESYNDEEENGFDTDSPEAKEIIKAVAEAFGLDPAMLGGGDEEDPAWDVPEEAVAVEVATWNGGGSAIIR